MWSLPSNLNDELIGRHTLFGKVRAIISLAHEYCIVQSCETLLMTLALRTGLYADSLLDKARLPRIPSG